MNREDKISFLKTLSELDKQTNIREELLSKLNKKLKDKKIDEVEQIIFDLLEGLKSNEELLNEIFKLENIKIENIVNEKINNNIIHDRFTDIRFSEIKENHIYLIKFLIKYKLLSYEQSKTYINKFVELVEKIMKSSKNDKLVEKIMKYLKNDELDYSLNPLHPFLEIYYNYYKKVVSSIDNLVDLFYLNFLNVYLNLFDNDKEELMKKIEIGVKNTITFYIRFLSEPLHKRGYLLVPLSIISIFTGIYNQSIQINGTKQFNINEIFNIILDSKNFYSHIEFNLKILKELDAIYQFLEKLNLAKIENNFVKLILNIILEENLYTDQILIDFCSLFSNNVSEKYKEIIDNKTKEDNYWYKGYVLKNFSTNNNLRYETLKFLQFVENWKNDRDIKEKVEKVTCHIDNLDTKNRKFTN